MIHYSRKAGGEVVDRPPVPLRIPETESIAAGPLSEAANAYPDIALRGVHGGDTRQLDSWCASYEEGAGRVELFNDAHLSDPKITEGGVVLPEIGSEFCGFELVAELGRGAFGRVFLSHQGDLAGRPVALKVSTEIRDESQRLARLQHTNIVPIYSFHRLGSLQAVCMPYFGSATLADVVAELGRRDSLPASGKMVASTVYDRRSRTLRTVESRATNVPARPAPPVAPTAERPVPEAPATQELKRLEGLTYVESILWIAARLADGLAHAHDRGIFHRDLKPANVLLTDDGQPMLLDFNLAEDSCKVGPGAAQIHIGGTLPYMAPEHLEAFGGTWRDVDARSDLYSLGVILYELLTGRPPFIRRTGPPEKILPEMIAERRTGAPELSRYNKAVSPAAEAIVRKCLDAEPARRYQTARDLKEDLERHLANLPLRHQLEPSRREQAQKWLRRNSWVRSAAAVTTVSAAIIVAMAAMALSHKQRAEHEEAINRLADFRKDQQAAQALLYARSVDRIDEEEGRAAARRALDRYGVLTSQPWREQAAVRQLPDDHYEQLMGEVGETLVLLAGSIVPDKGATADQKAEALRLNRQAESCFAPGQSPRALWAQRAELVDDSAEAQRLRDQAQRISAREGWDHYLAARVLLHAGKMQEAIDEARETARIDPQSFAAWFLLGNCTLPSGGYSAKVEAAVHYTTCASLRPEFFAPYFNRGLARIEIKEYAKAETDFTRAIELRPNFAEAHLQRALAREKLGNSREALADLDQALSGGVAPARVFLVRSRLREQLGDRVGAKQDLADGLRETPVNCRGWIDRGMARLVQKDAEGALADFAEAVRCDPLSREAIHDQAYVVGELLKRPKEAIPLLDRELELYPNQPIVVACRGVYHARLGQRDAALADVRQAVAKAPRDAEVLYRAASVFALTSLLPGDPKADRRQAVGYLAGALERGFGFEDVDKDSDLTPLLNQPEFEELRKLVETTKKLKGWL